MRYATTASASAIDDGSSRGDGSDQAGVIDVLVNCC
jgi:hypothetical protein